MPSDIDSATGAKRSASPEGEEQHQGRQRSRAACAPCKSAAPAYFDGILLWVYRQTEEAQMRRQTALWDLRAI